MFSAPALSANELIAELSVFSGDVLVRTQGSWEIESRANMPLYSDDKVVTKNGTAKIIFKNDGAVMELKDNSNLLINEEKTQRGVFKKVTIIERKLRLISGKLYLRNGRTGTINTLETPTLVCGLKDIVVGIISIGADGQSYMSFSEGGVDYIIGDFIQGIAADVSTEESMKNKVQWAAFNAAAIANRAKKAKENTEALINQENVPMVQLALAEAELAAAQATLESLNEIKQEILLFIENNPDKDLVTREKKKLYRIEKSLLDANAVVNKAIEKVKSLGGDVTALSEVSTPALPEQSVFDIQTFIEPDINDMEPASPI